MNYFNFPKWNIELLKHDTDYAIYLIGSRYSGKSKFIEYLWRSDFKKIFDLAIIFSDNPQADGLSFLTKKERRFVYPYFEPQILKDIDYFQNKTENSLHIWIIFDDCSIHNKFDNMLQQLYTRGRNIRTTVLFSTQYHLNLSTNARANLDWLFLLDIHTVQTREKVIATFLKGIITPQDSSGIPLKIKKYEKEEWITEWMKKYLAGENVHNILGIDFRNGDILYQYRCSLKRELSQE